jgi:DNA repair exonuclease SbcCD nuclease subunit
VNKIIITADWHFGHPERLDDLKWAFNKMLDYCIREKIEKIFMLGDLTHHREYLTHDVSNAITELFQRMCDNNVEMVLFPGNHDMFNRFNWEITALKPFGKFINLIENVSNFEYGGRKFWCIPFVESEQTFMKIIDIVNDKASEDDILLTHVGITNATYNMCFLIQNWSIVNFDKTKFSRIYAGHFHCHQKVGEKSWVPGSPIPFRFDEGLVTHGFFVYDPKINDHQFVEFNDLPNDDSSSPPDFITSDDVDSIIKNVKGNNVKILLKEGQDESEIKKILKDAGALKIIIVKPKDKIIKIDKNSIMKEGKDIFESWIDYDKPEGLDKNVLLLLEKDIRSQTKIEEEDDID